MESPAIGQLSPGITPQSQYHSAWNSPGPRGSLLEMWGISSELATTSLVNPCGPNGFSQRARMAGTLHRCFAESSGNIWRSCTVYGRCLCPEC
jgi:hypothetical protein